MTRKMLLSRKRQRSGEPLRTLAPHSSWSRRERASTGITLAPDDFWSRLGL